MPCKSGSPQEVFNAASAPAALPAASPLSADVRVMEAERRAKRAAAAMTMVIFERGNRSRMMSSVLLLPALLQRIVFDAHEIRGVVFCCRVRTLPFNKGVIFNARRLHQRRQCIVPFDAA